jgi:hypothetical protein
MFDAAAVRYQLTFADPGATAVARVLSAADQLVLVAPASPDAARAFAMTQEWLSTHGYGALSANSIAVVNGLTKRSVPHAEQAELVVRGRCRAIVRVPWDDQLEQRPAPRMPATGPGQQGKQHWAGVLGATTAGAFTALAGVLVSSLADRADRSDRAGVTELVGRVPAQAGADPGHEPAEAGRGRR